MIRFPLLYSSDFPGIKSSLYFHFLCFFESESSLPYPLRTQEISIWLFAHLMNSGNPWSHLYGISLGLLFHYHLGILEVSLCTILGFLGSVKVSLLSCSLILSEHSGYRKPVKAVTFFDFSWNSLFLKNYILLPNWLGKEFWIG